MRFVILPFLCVLACSAWSGTAATKGLPVFPDATGFGIQTPAGRGGKIIRVTSLASNGKGSLRAALETKGKRTVVFEVGGVIDLKRRMLRVVEPFLTVAGQTAPWPGLTIIRGNLRVETNDVLIQHIRVRAGDAGSPRRSGWAPDCISVGCYGETPVHSVVVDHCTFTWAVDECTSVSGRGRGIPRDVTLSNCIIAEGLSNASHSKGEHSKGTLVMNGSKNVALIANLYAHNFRRNPYTKSATTTFIANNYIYNPGQLGIHISHFGGTAPRATVVGNAFQAGPNTPKALNLLSAMGRPRVYLKDNLGFVASRTSTKVLTRGGSGQVRKWNARFRPRPKPEVWPSGFNPVAGEKAKAMVLAKAGAWPARRDAIDKRLIDEIRAGRGRIIDSQTEVGGYPAYKPTRHELKLPAKPNTDDDGDGYTNLEEWLHAKSKEAESGTGKAEERD